MGRHGDDSDLGGYLGDFFGGAGGEARQPYVPPTSPRVSYTNPESPQRASAPNLTNPWGIDWSQYPSTPGQVPGSINFTDPNNRPQIPLGTATNATTTPFDVNAFGRAWTGSGGRTNQDFLNFYNQYPGAAASGWKIGGSHGGNLEGPNGQAFDAVISSGLGGQGAWWNPRTGAVESGGGYGGGAGAAAPASTSGTYGDPAFQRFLDMLMQHEADTKARAGTFASQLGTRVQQLQQPLLNDSQVASQRAAYSNRLLSDRDAALARSRENAAVHGWGPNSGIIEGSNRAIQENYNNRQTGVDAALQNAMIQTDEQRRNEATQLQGLATQALEGGDIGALQSQAQAVNLSNMGLDNAMRVLGGGGTPGSALSAILSLLGPAAGQQNLGLGINQSNMGGLGTLLSLLLG